jgi:26S proteasome regulatory subunit N13
LCPCSAPPGDANDAVQNFLRSLQGSSVGSQQQQQQQSSYDRPYTTLSELLSTNNTIPWLSSTSPEQIDALCMHLPPSLFLLAQESAATSSSAEPSEATARAAIEAMATEQKRDLLQRVLRSPQLTQSLGSLTFALRDGGLPMVSEALGVKVQNGGMVKGGSVPLGGGEAVEAFVEGVKKGVQDQKK